MKIHSCDVYRQSIHGTSWWIGFKYPTRQGHELDDSLSHGSQLNYHMKTSMHQVTVNMLFNHVYTPISCDCTAALDKWWDGTLPCHIPCKLRLFNRCLTEYVWLCVCVCVCVWRKQWQSLKMETQGSPQLCRPHFQTKEDLKVSFSWRRGPSGLE